MHQLLKLFDLTRARRLAVDTNGAKLIHKTVNGIVLGLNLLVRADQVCAPLHEPMNRNERNGEDHEPNDQASMSLQKLPSIGN